MKKPIQQRAMRSRQALLDAARDAFSEKGFHGSRIDEIADQAGVNKQRIYAYFKDKAGLFAAVLRSSFDDLVAAERRLLKLTPRDAPRLAEVILSCYLDLHDRHPEFWRLLAWENLENARHSAMPAGLQEPILSHLRTLYSEGQRTGHFDAKVPFEAFIFTLLATSFFMASNRRTLKLSIGMDLSTRRRREALCSAVLRMIQPDHSRKRSKRQSSAEPTGGGSNTCPSRSTSSSM